MSQFELKSEAGFLWVRPPRRRGKVRLSVAMPVLLFALAATMAVKASRRWAREAVGDMALHAGLASASEQSSPRAVPTGERKPMSPDDAPLAEISETPPVVSRAEPFPSGPRPLDAAVDARQPPKLEAPYSWSRGLAPQLFGARLLSPSFPSLARGPPLHCPFPSRVTV